MRRLRFWLWRKRFCGGISQPQSMQLRNVHYLFLNMTASQLMEVTKLPIKQICCYGEFKETTKNAVHGRGGGGIHPLFKTGSLDNVVHEFSLAWPSWYMSSYTMLSNMEGVPVIFVGVVILFYLILVVCKNGSVF